MDKVSLIKDCFKLSKTHCDYINDRCFELLSLQAGDIEEDCVGPAPYHITHFKVHLTNRKGWQKEKGYDGPRTSEPVFLSELILFIELYCS
jgi:hypothetical protein